MVRVRNIFSIIGITSTILFLSIYYFSKSSQAQNLQNIPKDFYERMYSAAKKDIEIAEAHGTTIDVGRRGGFHHLRTSVISIISEHPELASQVVSQAIKIAPNEKKVLLDQIHKSFPFFFSEHRRKEAHPYSSYTSTNNASKLISQKTSSPSSQINNLDQKFIKNNNLMDGYALIDPLERINRIFFYTNGALDFLVFEPLAKTYRFFLPTSARKHIRLAINNLGEPLTFVNDIIALDFSKATVSLGRFAINSTFGIAGFFDVASQLNLPSHSSDLGKTLYNYGLGDGIYLVLPFFGPTTTRDSFGIIGNMALDPKSWILNSSSRLRLSLTQGIVEREFLIEPIDEFIKKADNPYEAVRAWTWQKRQQTLLND